MVTATEWYTEITCDIVCNYDYDIILIFSSSSSFQFGQLSLPLGKHVRYLVEGNCKEGQLLQ